MEKTEAAVSVAGKIRAKEMVLSIEVVFLLALIVVGTNISYHVLRQSIGPTKVHAVMLPPMFEAENLPITAKSSDLIVEAQGTESFTLGTWSNETQLFIQAHAPGEWIELPIPGESARKSLLTVYLTKAGDYGVVSFEVNGVPLGSPVDLWAKDMIVPTGPIDLGIADLKGKSDRLRIKVVGHNSANQSPHFFAGIDGFTVRQVD